MNIFAIDKDPIICAQNLDDKRVGKILMEANQMLSLAVKINSTMVEEYDIGPGKLCAGLAHKNHPVSIWVRATSGNFNWTVEYAHALADEFYYRFEKNHASSFRTQYISKFHKSLPSGPLQDFHNSARNRSLDLDFTHIEDVCEAYKKYLSFRWMGDRRWPLWTKREKPTWFNCAFERIPEVGEV